MEAVREMLLADDPGGRDWALAKLLPMQREDFKGIFRVLKGRPATIRTLDPPLHEFLPHSEAEILDLAGKMGIAEKRLRGKIAALHEANPMLGLRGCRLGIIYPEITEMQVRAILDAACDVEAEGTPVRPEIMIPLVGVVTEFEAQKAVVDRVAGEVFAARGRRISYSVGTMIELPRAAITAGRIAAAAEVFSYGTNDLTQTTFGLSRDDAGAFLARYVEEKLLPEDPFQSVDQAGVGYLMRLGVEHGRAARPYALHSRRKLLEPSRHAAGPQIEDRYAERSGEWCVLALDVGGHEAAAEGTDEPPEDLFHECGLAVAGSPGDHDVGVLCDAFVNPGEWVDAEGGAAAKVIDADDRAN